MNKSQTNPPIVIHNTDELANAVQKARESKTPLVDYGLFHAQLGHQPPVSHTAFTQSGNIIEHYANDFTITASTGITMGQLNEQLMATGQFLPVNSDDDLTKKIKDTLRYEKYKIYHTDTKDS
ncbi:MAG: FAD-binding protein, partial [Phycisphaeraceae bacterium]|nr:FAD-binding protein [Phycisphaeraceae bacterium]